jgi:hypothetical protein
LPDLTPKLDVAALSVDADIQRLIRQHGAEKVHEAIRRRTARKLGRPPTGDWSELGDTLRQDAREWLEGGDPFGSRSNYSIAQEFTKRHRGQSDEATFRRIMGKLSKRRRYYALVEAVWLSQDHYPHAANLRAVRELAGGEVLRDVWQDFLRIHDNALTEYEKKFGEPPADMTMKEVLTAAAERTAPKISPRQHNVLQGLSGVRSE